MNTRQALEIERQRLSERFQEQPEGRVFAPLADCHRKLGQLDEALQICLTGLARHPSYSSAHVILGKIHLERGDLPAARAAFERVLEIDAQNLLALRQLAELDEEVGDLRRAAERWRQVTALELDPASAQEHLERVEAQLAEEAAHLDAGVEQIAGAVRGEAEAEGAGAPSTTADVVPAERIDASGQSGPNADEIVVEAAESPSEPTVDRGAAPTEPALPPPSTAEPAPSTPAADLTRRQPRRSSVPTAEIATMTLAEIYAEQGFRAKAVEIYRQILARNPEVETLHERIAALEAESTPPTPPAPTPRRPLAADEPSEAHLDELEDLHSPEAHSLEAPLTDVGTSAGTAADQPIEEPMEEPVVTHSPPIQARTSPESEERAEQERFNHFRSWLDRIRVDEN